MRQKTVLPAVTLVAWISAYEVPVIGIASAVKIELTRVRTLPPSDRSFKKFALSFLKAVKIVSDFLSLNF